MGKPNFSLDDFKKWMKEYGNFAMERKPKLEGTLIESRIPVRKLLEKISPEEGELNNLAEDFYNNGGIIQEINDSNFLVKVDSGIFYLGKKYVKRN